MRLHDFPVEIRHAICVINQVLSTTSPDPLIRRIRQHAEKRLQFVPGSGAGERLPKLKEYARLEREMLQRYHRKGDSGLRVAKARSMMVDVLLQQLFKYATETYKLEHGKLPCEVALVALGGYGREELCPFSDIDLMFLYPKRVNKDQIKPLQEALTNDILYPLWDLNLKVGHSSRTIKETLEEAKVEDQSKNALLEARLICGSERVFSKFTREYNKFLEHEDPTPYVRLRLEDQAERRKKYGGTVFLQEPDIKNGVGGLRDYQNILWMARVRLGEGSLDALERRHYLNAQERKHLENAYNFLLRVRNELHFESVRPTDLLNLEKQPSIAWALGYRRENIFRRVEWFMRDYYSHANRIYTLSRLLEQRLAITGMPGKEKLTMRDVIHSRQMSRQKHFDGFILRDGVISAEHNGIFTEDPDRLIRVFRYSQQHRAQLEIELQSLISNSTQLITPRITHAESPNRTFRSILQERGQVHPTLSLMHELGVLGRFIPEFGELTCLVQHEFYHRYTADIHVLNTIHELDKVFEGEGELVAPYREAIRQAETPGLLYLILLLHDLGKSDGVENHCDRGVTLAKPILKRMGVSEKFRPLVLFIIKNHLEMARFWQRFDVDDPRTIESFAELVENEEALRHLFVCTYCDARGTAESLWNEYKDSLHRPLYRASLDLLHDEEAVARKTREHIEMIHKKLIADSLPDIPEDQIEAHFNLLPERYFLHNSAADIELHLRMINNLLGQITEAESVGSLVPMVDWRDDIDQGMSIVNVVTWDRAGLFYKLAGALTVAGVNILSTKAISRGDHITIDTFYVVDPSGGVVTNPHAREVFEKELNDALLTNKDLMTGIQEKARQASRAKMYETDSRLRAPIPATVDIYHELSLHRTIVEVQTNDHIGLLYQLSKAIFDHGFDITFARISTERTAALDTFYIERISPENKSDTSSLVALRETLNRIISCEDFQAVI
ncbi:[protein-PII] uridylyltransferase [Ruficoccus sp. ZRK36]|uniref:[protein-PII] uridylyltransferase n=1 Tax=Ruficoccus sp. ZRK36 TaxID=2866311 RepID=UPI001C72F9F9|nr:[protein-PII] uridylyltransferase [Ruficoccus sp. ZRK36]QYY36038.1 [protein-PII] uridylyltransferase [Ruficoccus sp. ZRK36]